MLANILTILVGFSLGYLGLMLPFYYLLLKPLCKAAAFRRGYISDPNGGLNGS